MTCLFTPKRDLPKARSRVNLGRIARGISVAKLASMTGLSVRRVRQLDAEFSVPSMAELVRLAEALNLGRSWFVRPTRGFEGPSFVCSHGADA